MGESKLKQISKVILGDDKFCERHGKQGDVTRSDWWDALDAWYRMLPEKMTSKSPAMGGAQQTQCTAHAKVLGWDSPQGIGGAKGRSSA